MTSRSSLCRFMVEAANNPIGYNPNVPTPFYHLNIAGMILGHPDLPAKVCALLASERCSFLFGNTAPDVQVVSSQRRRETHFFTLPIPEGASLPWDELLRQAPSLCDPTRLPAPQAAFICGYLCHLQADWMWVLSIYGPEFSRAATWGERPHRSYIHNVLRTYLDQQAIQALPAHTGACLDSVNPNGYLPFTADHSLCEWRDFLSSQLKPGGIPQTVEVFARRQALDPQSYYDLLQSEERMETEVFSHVSRQQLDAFRQNLVRENISLVSTYLEGHFASPQLETDQ